MTLEAYVEKEQSFMKQKDENYRLQNCRATLSYNWSSQGTRQVTKKDLSKY